MNAPDSPASVDIAERMYHPYDVSSFPDEHLKTMMNWTNEGIDASVERSNRSNSPAVKVAEHRLRGFLEGTRSEVERETLRRLTVKE